MKSKRNKDNYPLLNGEWIDNFADKLLKQALKKEAADAGVTETGAAGAPMTIDDWVKLGIDFARNNPNLSNIDQILSHFQNDPAYSASYSKLDAVNQIPQIKSQIDQGIAAIKNGNVAGQQLTVDQIAENLKAVLGGVVPNANEIKSLVREKLGIEINGDIAAQISVRMIPPAKNMENIKTLVQNYINNYGIRDIGISTIDLALDSLQLPLKYLSGPEKDELVIKLKGHEDKFDIDAIIKEAEDLSKGGIPEADIINKLTSGKNYTEQQKFQIKQAVSGIFSLSKMNDEQKNLVNTILNEIKSGKVQNWAMTFDALFNVNQSAMSLQPTQKQTIQDAVDVQFAKYIKLMEEEAKKYQTSATNQSKKVDDVLLSANIPDIDKAFIKNILGNQSNLEGSFDPTEVNTLVSSIKTQMSEQVSFIQGAISSLQKIIGNKRDTTTEQSKSYSDSLTNYANNLRNCVKTLESFSSLSSTTTPQGATVSPVPSAPAAAPVSTTQITTSSHIGSIKISGIAQQFGKIRDLIYGPETDATEFGGIKSAIQENILKLNQALIPFVQLKQVIDRPDTPENYKQIYNSATQQLSSVKTSIDNVASTFGFPVLSVEQLNQILNNASQAAAAGAKDVDSQTGSPEQGTGQRVSPQAIQEAMGQKSSTRDANEPKATGKETAQEVKEYLQNLNKKYKEYLQIQFDNKNPNINVEMIGTNMLPPLIDLEKWIVAVCDKQTPATPTPGAETPGTPATGTTGTTGTTGAPSAPAIKPSVKSAAKKSNWIKV